MPDDLLGVDRFAVYDSGDLAVGAARVKADAAAVRMATDLSGLLVRLREARLVREDDLKRRSYTSCMKPTSNSRVPPARYASCMRFAIASSPQRYTRQPPTLHREHLDAALGIAVVRLGEFRAAQLCLVYGHKTVFALDGNFERAFRAFFHMRWPRRRRE